MVSVIHMAFNSPDSPTPSTKYKGTPSQPFSYPNLCFRVSLFDTNREVRIIILAIRLNISAIYRSQILTIDLFLLNNLIFLKSFFFSFFQPRFFLLRLLCDSLRLLMLKVQACLFRNLMTGIVEGILTYWFHLFLLDAWFKRRKVSYWIENLLEIVCVMLT